MPPCKRRAPKAASDRALYRMRPAPRPPAGGATRGSTLPRRPPPGRAGAARRRRRHQSGCARRMRRPGGPKPEHADPPPLRYNRAMRTEAAKERTPPLAAARVSAHPGLPARTRHRPSLRAARPPRPAGRSSSRKLATGLSTIPIESNIRVTRHLTPKTRWTVVYDYRNRWYLPEAGVFGERDPEGYSNGPDLLAFCQSNAVNMVDPLGLQNYFHPDAVGRSEPLPKTHIFLMSRMGIMRGWSWYKYLGAGANGVLEIRFMGSGQAPDYPHAIVGGKSYPELMDRLEDGSWVISPGQPPEELRGPNDDVARNENIMWQRMRIYQLEKTIDGVWARANSEGVIRPLWKVWRKRVGWTEEKFEAAFAFSRLEATKLLMERLQVITRANPTLNEPLAVEAGNTVVSALVVAEGENEALRFLRGLYSPDLDIAPRPRGSTKAFPPYISVVGGKDRWWWDVVGPSSH